MANKTFSKLPWVVLLLLTLVGLVLSVELTILHVRVFLDPNYQSFCSINAKFNCVTVAQSPYSVFLRVPVSMWGIVGYLLILLFGLAGFRTPNVSEEEEEHEIEAAHQWRRTIHGALFFLTLCSFVAGAIMGSISFLKIDSLCILCMGTYAINLILPFVMWLARRNENISAGEGFGAATKWSLDQYPFMIVLVLLLVGLYVGYPKYWETSGTFKDQNLSQGFDKKHPWIGAKKPRIVITEFGDYECPFCSRAHAQVRQVVRENPGTVRLLHRHYPLDRACNVMIKRKFHEKACLLARASICAGAQDKFWHMNDVLYKYNKTLDNAKLMGWARKFGMDHKSFKACIKAKGTKALLESDIEAGIRYGMEGTPYFVIDVDGQNRYKGHQPMKDLTKLLQELSKSPAPR